MANNYNVIIGGQTYQLMVWLWNQLEDYPPALVQPFFIDSLCIEETLNNWWIDGWLVLNNDLELFERGNLYGLNMLDSVALAQSVAAGVSPIGVASIPNSLLGGKSPYLFRTDGRNRLSIQFYPVKADGIAQEFSPTSWELSVDCVVYDMEDLPSDNVKKKKKIYFHSEIYQYCVENNIEFSTSKDGNVPDIQRTLPANEALQGIIKSSASFQTAPVSIGYNALGSIAFPNIPLDTGLSAWDIGPADTNNIFYTSPANASIFDDINYLKPHLEASNGGPVILSYGRSNDTKGWTLNALSKYFDEAEKTQVERIILADGMDRVAVYVPRAPTDPFLGTQNNVQNFMSGQASLISSYQYVPMVSIDDRRITNRPLHHYDFAEGSFKIKFTNNNAAKVNENLYDYSKTGLYSFKQNKGQISQNSNQTKTTGRMTTNEFLPNRFHNPNLPANQMVLDSVFMGNALYFQTNGLTIRTPGKFLFVDRVAATASNPKHPFDDKFLGQWIMTKVVHYIDLGKSTYINDVIATKVDSFTKLWPTVDTKF